MLEQFSLSDGSITVQGLHQLELLALQAPSLPWPQNQSYMFILLRLICAVPKALNAHPPIQFLLTVSDLLQMLPSTQSLP